TGKWALNLSVVGLLASRQACQLFAGSGDQFLVGVCVAGQAPAAVGCLGQQHPGPAGQPGVAGGVGGDRGQPLDHGELLAAVERACVGEDLDPHVVAFAVDVGQAPGGQVVDEGGGVLPEHGD